MLHINGTTPVSVLSEGVCKFPGSSAWATKYLHPPSPMSANYSGIPDAFNSPSVHSAFAISGTNIIGSSLAGGPDKNYTFLVAPGICNPIYQIQTYSDAGVLNIVCSQKGRANYESGYGQTNPLIEKPINDVESLRLAYRSSTFYQNTNTLTDKGIVTCAGLRPDTFTYTSTTFARFVEKYSEHEGYADVARAICPDRVKSEYIVVPEPGPRPSPRIFGGASVQVVDLGRVPLNAAELIEINPITSTQWMSRDGAYTPTKFSQPINAYKSSSGQVENAGGTVVDERLLCAFSYSFNGVKKIQFFSAAKDGAINSKNACVDYAWSDFRWYWVNFEGLDVASNITIKTIMGWEFQPSPGSLLMTQVRPAAVPDELCMNALAEISNIGCDAFMAKFNGQEEGLTVAKEKLKETDSSAKAIVNDLMAQGAQHNAGARAIEENKSVVTRKKKKPQKDVRREDAEKRPPGDFKQRDRDSNKVPSNVPVRPKIKPAVKAAKADLKKAEKELAVVKTGKRRPKRKVARE